MANDSPSPSVDTQRSDTAHLRCGQAPNSNHCARGGSPPGTSRHLDEIPGPPPMRRPKNRHVNNRPWSKPQDPSLSEHITRLLASQSWVPPKLPLNTQAVTKDVYEFTAEEQQVAKEKYAALLASNLEEADLLSAADMLSALSPNTAAVAIKIPLHNLSQLLSWPACLNATRVTEASDPNFSLEKFRITMLVVALRPVAQFFTRHLQQLKELKSVKEHHTSLMMLIDPAFWEAVLLEAMQHFQNTALCRARLAHVYTVGEGHDQRIDRLYVHLPPIEDASSTHFASSSREGDDGSDPQLPSSEPCLDCQIRQIAQRPCWVLHYDTPHRCGRGPARCGRS